jgi:hypothetical protein
MPSRGVGPDFGVESVDTFATEKPPHTGRMRTISRQTAAFGEPTADTYQEKERVT